MKSNQLKKIVFALIFAIACNKHNTCQGNNEAVSYQIIPAFIASYIIHYAGQTCTNTLYTLLPKLQKSNLSIITSLVQYTISCQIAGNTIKQMNISEWDNALGHLLGSIIAKYIPKPCELYQEYFSKKISQELNLPDGFTIVNDYRLVTDENNNPCLMIKDKNGQLYLADAKTKTLYSMKIQK